MFLWLCLRWPESRPAPTPQALHTLATAMLQYSPKVACFRGNSVALEVAASLKLFGGACRLARRVRHTADTLGLDTRLGMAPSATGAWLLAGAPASRRRVLRTSSLARNLAGLPLHCLPEAAPHLQWLENIGCRHLGCVRALPRQGLKQRTSPAFVHVIDTAHAQESETLSWFEPPPGFQLAYEPDIHLDRAEAILAAAQPLLQALCGWLQSRQDALHDFVFVMHHEKGRQACLPTSMTLRFSDAVWRLEDFNLLLAERLRHCSLQRVAIRLEIIAGPAQRRAPVSDTLFPDPSRHAHEERRLLDLLTARLGRNAIRRPRPRAGHLPEQANIWANDPAAPTCGEIPSSTHANARPFWLLSQPQALTLLNERPIHQGRPLRLVQGPERIETGWYAANHQRRDYFVAEDPQGARYWVYRERETGEGWFLHGLFA